MHYVPAATIKRPFSNLLAALLITLAGLTGTPALYGQTAGTANNEKVDGYRGIWWSIAPMPSRPDAPNYGSTDFKYSGPLSFAWPHTVAPMAVHAPEVNKTFFVYGGDTGPGNSYLLTMASYYDHEKHRVPKPTIVRDQLGVDDPHDNPSLTIDDEGFLWVFIAGRGRNRPGQIFRSREPYSVEAFDQIIEREQTYSQIWQVPDRGFFHLLTLYTSGRELYWETNSDGQSWSPEPAKELDKLAGFGGHYQVSRVNGNTIGTAFNYHPDGNVDRRTNLYYLQTSDYGETWTTVDGQPVQTPLDDRDNPALVVDYEARGRVAFPNKLLFDEDGHPVILHITAFGVAPVLENGPRVWKTTRWTGEEWVTRPITVSDHIYDMGSFYIHDDRWSLIAPALPGPQPGFTGGEVGVWETTDPDREWWQLKQRVTRDSPYNHGYMRRPHNPVDPFFAIWADSDSEERSISRLYFTNSTGDSLFKLPYTFEGDYAEPLLLDPPNPPSGEDTSYYK
ncbi:MAG: BNR-4 repeat-containing protein [Balneolales bacterium]